MTTVGTCPYLGGRQKNMIHTYITPQTVHPMASPSEPKLECIMAGSVAHLSTGHLSIASYSVL